MQVVWRGEGQVEKEAHGHGTTEVKLQGRAKQQAERMQESEYSAV